MHNRFSKNANWSIIKWKIIYYVNDFFYNWTLILVLSIYNAFLKRSLKSKIGILLFSLECIEKINVYIQKRKKLVRPLWKFL